MQTSKLIINYRLSILWLLFLVNVLVFWPGYPMADSTAQYSQALSGVYSDHHPPLMSFVWHYLNMLYPGFGLMWFLQLSMLYLATNLLLLATDFLPFNNRAMINLLILALPVYPQILLYELVVLKDLGFAYSFMLVAASLSYYTIAKQKPTKFLTCCLVMLLIYGAALKYQAQYCAIVLVMWLSCVINNTATWPKKIFIGLVFYAMLLLAVLTINSSLVPVKSRDYAWQYVKLYDLAAISDAKNIDLIPQFNRKDNYSFEKLQQRFSYPAIDSLVFLDDPILAATKSITDMRELRNIWYKTVLKYPLIYLKHRLRNISYMLIARPGFEHEAQDVPFLIHNDVALGTAWNSVTGLIIGALFYVFMSHLLVIIFGVAYLILAIVSWPKTIAAPVLFAFSSLALTLVFILFFMSMAGTPRYTYMSILMIHASHVFAYTCWRQWHKSDNALS